MLRVRVSITGVNGAPYVATHHFVPNGEGSVAAATAAAAGLWEDLSPLMVQEAHWEVENEVLELSTAGVVTGSYTVDGQEGDGTSTSEMLPSAAQLVLQWRTGVYLGGREQRGRTFVPALAQGVNDDGQTSAATRGVADAACLAFVNSGADPGVWSRKNSSITSIANGFCWLEFGMLTSRRD